MIGKKIFFYSQTFSSTYKVTFFGVVNLNNNIADSIITNIIYK